MRLLTYIHDRGELNRVTSLMTGKGIATHVVYVGRAHGPTRWAVFICINAQIDDAVRLLEDERHVVASPIDVAEFDRNAKTRNLRFIANRSTMFLLVAALVFAGIVWGLWRLQA